MPPSVSLVQSATPSRGLGTPPPVETLLGAPVTQTSLPPAGMGLGGSTLKFPSPDPNLPSGVPFPEVEAPPTRLPCSYNECLAGHKWPAQLALANCPGCTGGILAIQKTNCPFCNEPITRSVLRSDFIPRGGGVTARCQGVTGIGESLDIDMCRTSWREAETSTRTFLEQVAQENSPKEGKITP